MYKVYFKKKISSLYKLLILVVEVIFNYLINCFK